MQFLVIKVFWGKKHQLFLFEWIEPKIEFLCCCSNLLQNPWDVIFHACCKNPLIRGSCRLMCYKFLKSLQISLLLFAFSHRYGLLCVSLLILLHWSFSYTQQLAYGKKMKLSRNFWRSEISVVCLKGYSVKRKQ